MFRNERVCLMNVMTVGLASIALYALFVVLWLRFDRNKDTYADYQREDQL